MHALPLQGLRIPFDLRKPERRAVVMGRRDAKALGLESEAARGRRGAPRLDRPGFITHPNLLAGAPRAGLAAQRQGVDPAALLIGDGLKPAAGPHSDDTSIIAAGEQPLAVADRR